MPKSGVSPNATPRASTPVGSLRAPLSQTITVATAPASLHSGGTRLQLVQQGGTIKGEEYNFDHHYCYLYLPVQDGELKWLYDVDQISR